MRSRKAMVTRLLAKALWPLAPLAGLACATADETLDQSSAAQHMAASDGGDEAAPAGEGGEADAAPAPCEHQGPPVFNPENLPSCCDGSHCVPTTLIPASLRDRLADCEHGAKCVPDAFIASGGHFTPPSCRAVGEAEGRCLSSCLPDVKKGSALFGRGTCEATDLCVPCFNPLDGSSTGACGLSCDTGPKEPARLFSRCCGGEGACVPASLVPTAARSELAPDSCPADQDDLCAPDFLLPSAGGAHGSPAPCRSVGDGEGRCLMTCLPAVAAQDSRLPVATCKDTQRCAPCFDPISGAATGACSLGHDAPVEPAYVFPKCCGDRGTCVPGALVPEGARGQLNSDSCPRDGDLCAPSTFLSTPPVKPPPCRGTIIVVGYDGVCLPDCLPAFDGLKGIVVPRGSCADGERCAPCENPLTGNATGACG